MLRLTLTEAQAAASSLEEAELTQEELTALLTEYQVGEKDGYALIPALFKPCGPTCWRVGTPGDCQGGKPHRLKANVTHVTAFCADVDGVTEDDGAAILNALQAQGVEFWFWQTYGHNPEGAARGEPVGRFRVLVPFKEPLAIANADQWSKGAWPMLARRFGVAQAADAACKDPSRLYYLPRKPSEDTEREAAHFPGEVFDAKAALGDLGRIVPAVAIPSPIARGEGEDPSRPVDLEALKVQFVDARNPETKQLAQRCVRGEMLTSLPGERQDGEIARHDAWWRLTGRLSIVAEDWMSTEALLQVLKPSHLAERQASPDDFTPWDEGRDSVVEMLAMQRATAATRRATYKAERDAKNSIARNAINSLLKERGRAGLPERIEGTEDEAVDEPAPAPAPAEAWSVDEVQSNLEVKHSSTGAVTYPGSLQNLALVFTLAPEWAGAFRLNMLKDEFELWPCEGIKRITTPERFSDQLITDLRLALAINVNYPMKASKEEVIQAAEWAAKQRPYEPVQDYLKSLKWDGVKRLDKWLETYLHARTVTEEGLDLRPYLRAIGRRWMIAGVARAFRPGCKADDMLHIEGKQGAKKSSALAVLGGEWFMEANMKFDSNDTAVLISTAWITELGENAAFDRASEALQKAFLSRRVDTLVRKYEKYRTDLPRRCVFAGTTNEENGYLTDVTGNRRHWACNVDGEVDLESLTRDRDQLWAEAVAAFMAGEQWHLTDEEKAMHQVEVAKRVRTDIIDDLIESWFRRQPTDKRPKGVSPADIARKALEDGRGSTPKMKICGALKRLGFVNKAMRMGGEVVKRWETPARLMDAPQEGTHRDELLEQVAKAKPTAEA